MSRTSPQTISYKDILSWVRKQGAYALQRKTASAGRGVMNMEALTHDVECAKTLVRMLERCEPFKQVNLFELFQQVKK